MPLHNPAINEFFNYGLREYATWKDFRKEWAGDDQELVFRFDIAAFPLADGEGEGLRYELHLFLVQKNGEYVPVQVKQLTEQDMPDVESFLRGRWQYMTYLWREVSVDIRDPLRDITIPAPEQREYPIAQLFPMSLSRGAGTSGELARQALEALAVSDNPLSVMMDYIEEHPVDGIGSFPGVLDDQGALYFSDTLPGKGEDEK